MALVTDNTDFKVKSGIIMAGTATVTSSTGQTGTLQVLGGAAIAKNLMVGSSGTFYSSNTATTDDGGQGSLVVKGGAYINDNLIVMSTAFNTATGLSNAVYTEGGIYAKAHFTSEGPALFKDIVTFSGTATYVYSTNTVYTDNILELHTPETGPEGVWTFDDGKDIGIRIHYYGTTGSNAALVFANDTKKFEFYKSGAEGTSTFSSGIYGGIKAGSLLLEDTTATNSTNTGALIVAGGIGLAGGIYSGDGINAQTLAVRSLTDTRLVVAGLNGQLYDYADLTYNTSTNIIHGRITTSSQATTSTNLAGGSAGALVFQTSTGLTSFIAIATATYVLTSNGTEPYWAPTGSAFDATTATNLAGGLQGQIPFQSSPGITTFSSTLTFNASSRTLEVNGGSTSTGHISVSGNVYSSGTVFSETLRVSGQENSTSTTTGAATVVGGMGVGKDLRVGGTITVGPISAGLVSGEVTGITGTSVVNLDSYSGSEYRSARYFVQLTDGSDVHVTEISVFHDGVDVYKTEYGYHYNNSSLGNFSATYTSSNVTLTFQPVNATNMSAKLIRWSITP